MDTAQWPQEIGFVKPMEEIVPNACPSRPVLERSRTRPQKEQALNCPRCNSTNTKFCYYNNYSLTQPRYFCKTCRRYWTEGGSLRNVPVGGGSRKNKRSSSSSSLSSSSLSIASATATATSSSMTTSNTLLSSKIKLDPDHLQNPKINEGQDLNLGFPASAQDYPRIPAEFIELPTIENRSNNNNSSSSSTTTTTTTVSALDLLRSTTTGITSTGIGLSSFMPMPLTVPLPDINAVYSSSGFGNLQDFKQQAGLNFVGGVDDGLGSSGTGYGGVQLGSGSNGRLLIPFEELKPSTNGHQYDQNIRGQAAEATGYWSGMLGGTGSW